jgi:hypothetical protein
VTPLEWKLRLVVVESGVGPLHLIVAVSAEGSEGVLVRVILSMAGDAIGRRLAMPSAHDVTPHARGARMGPTQRVVAEIVVEAGGVEADDVGIATAMIGVADAAIGARRPDGPRVEARVRPEVVPHVLVALEAQGALLDISQTRMASATLPFHIRVRLDHRPRHHELLEIGCAH